MGGNGGSNHTYSPSSGALDYFLNYTLVGQTPPHPFPLSFIVQTKIEMEVNLCHVLKIEHTLPVQAPNYQAREGTEQCQSTPISHGPNT